MRGVIERSAFDIEVGRAFEERHQPLGGPRHPGSRKAFVIEHEGQNLEDVARRSERGKHIR